MRVTIIGGGYVGLPLAAASAAAGHDVCVFDVDEAKVSSINDGVSYIDDVRSDALANIQATTNPHVALFQHQPEVVLICVPTPLQHAGDPDVRFVLAAVDDVDQYLEQPDALVILESTVYPGFTREQLVERFGDRFAVAFSPERIDPANTVYGVTNTPKVVGGSPRAAAFYRSLGIPAVVELATPDEAEMVKILENTFRAVNIALVNELSLACRALGIDIWSVIDAASTKPFGFMPFYPGPGVGGHCIGPDPKYLTWRLRTRKLHADLVELAADINTAMPRSIVDRLAAELNDCGVAVRGTRVLVVGLAYKPNVTDTRESPAHAILAELQERGAVTGCYDPVVDPESSQLIDEPWDCAVLVTDHDALDYGKVADLPLILDTRDAFRRRGIQGRGKAIPL